MVAQAVAGISRESEEASGNAEAVAEDEVRSPPGPRVHCKPGLFLCELVCYPGVVPDDLSRHQRDDATLSNLPAWVISLVARGACQEDEDDEPEEKVFFASVHRSDM